MQFRTTDRESSNKKYNSRFDPRIIKHVQNTAPKGVIVISIIENNKLQKRNLTYQNGLWSEKNLEEKEVYITVKPSIADTCTSNFQFTY